MWNKNEHYYYDSDFSQNYYYDKAILAINVSQKKVMHGTLPVSLKPKHMFPKGRPLANASIPLRPKRAILNKFKQRIVE